MGELAVNEEGRHPIGHTVALTYNLKRPVCARPGEDNGRTGARPGPDDGRAGEAEGVPVDFYSECDSPGTIEAITNALHVGGHEVCLVEADPALPQWFLTHPVDLVFNIAEGARGAHRESQVPAILELLQIPFTGSGSLTLALALDKARTKQVLAYEGLPTPAWQLFETLDERLEPRLAFPLIVKPNCEGSAKGILRESVVWEEDALRRQVRRILEYYRQPALVEEFIEGTELTVGILDNDEAARALPILEIDFSGCQTSGEFFYSWRMKEYQGNEALGLAPAFYCPARLDPALTARVQAVALRAHRALGCWDFSRTDIRLHRDGTPFVLEVNPLPGLNPLESNFPLMTAAAGMTYPFLINHLVELALARAHHQPGRLRRTAAPVPLVPGEGRAHRGGPAAWAGRQDAQTQEPSPRLPVAALVEAPACLDTMGAGRQVSQLVESRTAP